MILYSIGASALDSMKSASRESTTDDWLWIVDHSNQIGQDKLLVVLGIRASDLPSPGQTLSLDQLTVLAIIPGDKLESR